ncbi:MAG: 16S rRNA (guanine(966)-N(2))-methyltransferase RsmD [bacterium]|nr:16S rRNA (guanine(966)-N(2))-methyltransferase RsmD [bacterium]
MAVRLMMRVIGGRYRGLRLSAPRGRGTRPPTGRVRESIFSALGERAKEADVLDLYAGSGSFGIEALSRGGRSAVFVERRRQAVAALRSNLDAVGAGDSAEVFSSSVESYLAVPDDGRRFNIVFADPPWDISSEDVAGMLEKVSGLMTRGAVAVVTRRASDDVPAAPGLAIEDRRRHGDTQIIRYLKE